MYTGQFPENWNIFQKLFDRNLPFAKATVDSFGSMVYRIPSYLISAFDIRLILLPRYGGLSLMMCNWPLGPACSRMENDSTAKEKNDLTEMALDWLVSPSTREMEALQPWIKIRPQFFYFKGDLKKSFRLLARFIMYRNFYSIYVNLHVIFVDFYIYVARFMYRVGGWSVSLYAHALFVHQTE